MTPALCPLPCPGWVDALCTGACLSWKDIIVFSSLLCCSNKLKYHFDCKSVLLYGKYHNLSLITGNNTLPEDIPLSSLLVISLCPKGLYLWLEIIQLQIIFLFMKVQSTFERSWTIHSSYILWQWNTFSSELSKAKNLIDRMDWLWQTVSREGQMKKRKTEEVCYTPLTCSLQLKMAHNFTTELSPYSSADFCSCCDKKASVLFSALWSCSQINVFQKTNHATTFFLTLLINATPSKIFFSENYVWFFVSISSS